MMIDINVAELTRDINRITDKFGKLGQMIGDHIPPAVAPAVVKLMQIYEPQKSVRRITAYGQTFQSDKQRRYVMWAIGEGVIRVPYSRTFAMREAWRIEGSGRNTRVVNDTTAARFTMGDKTQARLNKLVGWKTVGWRLQNPGREVLNAANNAIRGAIKQVGL